MLVCLFYCDDFETTLTYGTGLPLRQTASQPIMIAPWPTPEVHIHPQEVMSNQGEQLMFEGEQLTPGSKGYSFYKALFLLAKRANDISFLFTL